MSGGDWKELFNAACEGDLALVQYHVKNGVDINYAHPEFLSTPLVACLLAQQEQVAHYLLDHGALPGLHSEFDGLVPIEAAQRAGLTSVQARLAALGIQARPVSPPQRHWLARWLGM